MLDQLPADNLEYHIQDVMKQYDLSREDAQTFIQDQESMAREWAERDMHEQAELEEMREAYDENDPKHPDFTERMIARAEYLEDR
jgi:hypothetical protein